MAPSGLAREVALAPYTSLKVGGPAEFLLAVRTEDAARVAQRWAADGRHELRWLGGGSNVLIASAGVSGLVARYLGDDLLLPDGGEDQVIVGAGRSFPNTARALAHAGWSGLEWAANVPGSVGGAVTNNAGAFGSSVAETLVWADLLRPSGEVTRWRAEELGYSYRTSVLKRGELGPTLVLRAAFQVRRAPVDVAVSRVRTLQQQRTATQPRQLSAGSVFANPPDEYAGRLIEAAGLKGRAVGGARISEQHANFIVNFGGACAEDVYALISLAQWEVWRKFGRWLTPEIELFGRWTAAERARLAGPTGEKAGT